MVPNSTDPPLVYWPGGVLVTVTFTLREANRGSKYKFACIFWNYALTTESELRAQKAARRSVPIQPQWCVDVATRQITWCLWNR
jgi:hypothetical protein